MSGVLDVAGLAKSFGGMPAVRGVGFGVAAGEAGGNDRAQWRGEDHCFNLLNGQLAADAGSVKLQGAEIVLA